jgi:uncharacterized membrane protein YccC
MQGELRAALRECRQVFHSAIGRAAERLGDHTQTNISTFFAHLTRCTSSFSALFAFGDSLLQYLKMHSWEAEENNCDDPPKGVCGGFVQWWPEAVAFWGKSWLWYNADNLRSALKTAVGMLLASLFVSVSYLYDLSAPFSVWPGLTIAI